MVELLNFNCLMFGLGGLIGKFVDKKGQPEKNPVEKDKKQDWQIGDGWGDDIIDYVSDEEDESPRYEVQPAQQKQQVRQYEQAEKTTDKAERSNTFGMVSKIFSAAGNLVAADPNSGQQRKNDQQVMDLLLNENRQLRQLITRQSAEMEELKENSETLRLLEEETADENEVLQFKVKSLETLVSMEQGKDLSDLRLLDETNAQKRELQRQVSAMSAQIKAMNRLDTEVQEDDDFDMQQDIVDLRTLYQQHAIELGDADSLKVLTALYTSDRPVIRYYREALFQQVARKSLEQAEFLYKSMPAVNKEQTQLNSKMFIENKRLAADNGRLKKELQNMTQLYNQEKQDRSLESEQSRQNLSRVLDHAQELQLQAQQMKQDLTKLQNVHKSEVEKIRKHFLEPKLQHLSTQIAAVVDRHKKHADRLQTKLDSSETQVRTLTTKQYTLESKLASERQEATQVMQQALLKFEEEKRTMLDASSASTRQLTTKCQTLERQLTSERQEAAQAMKQAHQKFEEEKTQLLDANSTSQFCIDETEFAMQKEMIQHLTAEVASLNEKVLDRENELAEANEMINHLEFENNRQFNHMQDEVRHKEEMLHKCQEQIRQSQHDHDTHHMILQKKIEDQANEIEELQANYNYMVQQVNELQDQNQVLHMKLSHSPGSGLLAQEIAVPEVVQSVPNDDLVQQLLVKSQQISELMAKQTELEKMLEDKDDEIIELMQEVNKIQQEKSNIESVTAKPKPQEELPFALAQSAIADRSENRHQVLDKILANQPNQEIEAVVGDPNATAKNAGKDTKIAPAKPAPSLNILQQQPALKTQEPSSDKKVSPIEADDFFKTLKQPTKPKNPAKFEDFFASLSSTKQEPAESSSEQKPKPKTTFEDLGFFTMLSNVKPKDAPKADATKQETTKTAKLVVPKLDMSKVKPVQAESLHSRSDAPTEVTVDAAKRDMLEMPAQVETNVNEIKPKTTMNFKLDLPGLETSALEKIFTTAAEKQKAQPKFSLNLGFLNQQTSQDKQEETKAEPDKITKTRAHRRSHGQFDFNVLGNLVDEQGLPLNAPRAHYYSKEEGELNAQDVQDVVDQMQRNQQLEIAAETKAEDHEERLNISDLDVKVQAGDDPIQQNRWTEDLDMLIEVSNSEEQSNQPSSTAHSVKADIAQLRDLSQPASSLQSSRNPSISIIYDESHTRQHKQTNSEIVYSAAEILGKNEGVQEQDDDKVPELNSLDCVKAGNLENDFVAHENSGEHSNPKLDESGEEFEDFVEDEEDKENTYDDGGQAVEQGTNWEHQRRDLLAQIGTKFEPEPLVNATADFGYSNMRDISIRENSMSMEAEVHQNESAFFTRDHRVIKNASYGELKAHEKIEQQLQRQFQEVDEENNEQSFADQTSEAPKEGSVVENSDLMCQLDVMNQSNSELAGKFSIIEDQRNLNSLIGSLIHLEDNLVNDLQLRVQTHSLGSDDGLPIIEEQEEHFEGQHEIHEPGASMAQNEQTSPQKGWGSENSLEIIDEDIHKEESQKPVVPPLKLPQLAQRELNSQPQSPQNATRTTQPHDQLSPEVLVDGWGESPQDLMKQDTTRSIDGTYGEALNLLSSLQDTRKGLKDFRIETQQMLLKERTNNQAVQEYTYPAVIEEGGWKDESIELADDDQQSVKVNHERDLIDVPEEVRQENEFYGNCCFNNHDYVLVNKVDLGPLADEQLGFVQPESATDSESQAICSTCERPITPCFWMCSNLAESIQAASRGEDFLNPCNDFNLICTSCFGDEPNEGRDEDHSEDGDDGEDGEARLSGSLSRDVAEEVKEPEAQASVKDDQNSAILDFLNDVGKLKAAAFAQPIVSLSAINADTEEEKAGGDTGGGWGEDEEFDI